MKTIDLHFGEDEQEAAYAAFHDEKGPCRLVRSYHWASEGYWLEYPPYKAVHTLDHVLDKKGGQSK